ncbi:hypothetical protein ONZ45_g17690 [Pleurotus djamor]|nr:hypothetical protein ONZ45_g17690 [Pleurotus djamor]
MPWSTHPNITGVLYAGAPGEQTGPALVDVLYGAYNPRGRLPFSIADKEEDYGTTIVYNSLGFPDINYTEKLLLDYRYMDSKNITPRFPFGFGLSYTTFSYSSLSLPPSISNTNTDAVTITFTIKNTGPLDGTEIPQVYLGFPTHNANGGGEVGEPKRVLRGFEEVELRIGEEKRVSVVLSRREISFWDVLSHTWVVPSGTFTVWVGASINDVRLTGTFST